MMKSFFKKLAFVMALAMVFTTAAPAAKSAYAATEFTYAYQNAGAVDTLYMEAGDEVDLCFKGVKDYKNYDLQWKSANPLVATVDTKGVVKAVENGTTTIELVVGDGTVYTSTPVKVIVGEEVKVALGTSVEDTFTAKTLEVGTSVDLGFYGVPNYNEKNYSFTWISNAPEVAKVDQKGVVVAVASGSATVTVAIVNNVTGDTLAVTPVVITVPTPVVELTYEVKQISNTTAELVFNQDVTFQKSDVSLEIVYDGGFTATWPIKDFSCKGNKVTFAPYVDFQNGDKFIVKVGANDEGTEFTTKIGQPDQVVVSYYTKDFGDMGKGKAFTNGEEGTELVVALDAKLYYQGIDVSAIYSKDDVVYTLSQENENVTIDEYAGELVFSKANVPVTVIANYVYYDADDNEKKVPAVIELTSEMAPAYTVTGVKAWTIATGTEIDWSNPVHTVPAYDGGTIVALITDNYGGLTSTSDDFANKGIDGVKKYSESRFSQEGYRVTYSSANVEKLLVGEYGDITTYTKASVPAIFALRNSNLEGDQLVRNMYAGTITVKDARKLDKITVSTDSLTLVTDGKYTKDKVTVKAFDQYGGAWKETEKLVISCSVNDATNVNVTNDATFFEKDDFHFDGSKISSSKNTFTVTFDVAGKKASVRINLKDPKYTDATETDIKVTSYQLDATSVNQFVEKQDGKDVVSVAANITYYTLSNGYKVGTVTASQAALVTSAEGLKLTDKTAEKGDQFVVVYYPNGSIVGAVNEKGLGVSGTDGEFKVTVANSVGDQMQYDAVGTYTVKVLQVSSFNKKGEAVFSTKYSKNFKVDNTNKAVALMKQEKLETEKVNVADIIVDTMSFTLGGAKWDKIGSNDVADFKIVKNKQSGYIVIENVTFNVPLNGDNDNIYYTVYTVPVNKAVKVPSGFDWTQE